MSASTTINREDRMSDTIDENAAEIAAADAELEPILNEMTLYGDALATLDARKAAIEAEAMPIRDAYVRIGYRRDAARARLDVARYRALASDMAGREREYERVRAAALAAYRHAQSAYVASDKVAVERAYDAVHKPLQAMWARIDLPPGPDGITITKELFYATFYPQLIALKERMEALAGRQAVPTTQNVPSVSNVPVSPLDSGMVPTASGFAVARLS